MNEPLDYEAQELRDPRVSRFWVTFILAGAVTILGETLLLPSPYRRFALILLPCGMLVTATSLHVAQWSKSLVVAVLAGVLGPLACSILLLKMFTAFN